MEPTRLNAPSSMREGARPLSEDITVCMMEECPICLDEFDGPGRAVFTAECGHKFHFSCLLENVNHDEANASKCPVCRREQTEWPEQTSGLTKAKPYCTNCGKRSKGGQICESCGNALTHTPTAQERARQQAARDSVVVECPSCRVRCLVNVNARGTLQCPNGHLFQVRLPPGNGQANAINSLASQFNSALSSISAPVVIRQCPTCETRVQMPPNCRPGQYMCPLGHTFYYRR